MNPIRHLAGLILLSQGVQAIARFFNRAFLVDIAIRVAEVIAEKTDNWEDAEVVAAVFALEYEGKFNELTDVSIAHYVEKAVKKAESEHYSQWYAEIDKVIRSDAEVAEDDSHVPNDDEVIKDESNAGDVKGDTVEEVKPQVVEEPKTDEVKTDEPQALKDVAITDLTIPATVRKVLETAGLTTARAVLAYDVNPENVGGLIALGNFDEVRRKKTLEAIQKALA
jgi:tellurite resistance protein